MSSFLVGCLVRKKLIQHPRLQHGKGFSLAKRRPREAVWANYYRSLAHLVTFFVQILSLLSTEFSVNKAFSECRFIITTLSDHKFKLLFPLLVNLGDILTGSEKDERTASSNFQMLVHKLFYHLFIEEDKVLGTLISPDHLLADKMNYLFFILEIKRALKFWVDRRERKEIEEIERNTRIRKGKSHDISRALGGDAQGNQISLSVTV